MSNFPAQLRLKEMAEEDIYFARRDRELIEALRIRLCRSWVEQVLGASTSRAAKGPRRH